MQDRVELVKVGIIPFDLPEHEKKKDIIDPDLEALLFDLHLPLFHDEFNIYAPQLKKYSRGER